MKSKWDISFRLVSAAVLMQAIFGSYFYKPLLTEIFISLTWVIIAIRTSDGWRVKNLRSLYALYLISICYLIFSFFQSREIYWVMRQAAFILYSTLAVIGYNKLQNDPNYFLRNYKRLFFLGLLLMIQQTYFNFGTENSFFTAYLIFITGYTSWIIIENKFLFRMLLLIIAVVVNFATNDHFTFLLVPFVSLILIILIKDARYRIFLVVGIILLIIGLIAFADNLSDVNATWRYMYWIGVLQESWERGWFLVGKGFGIIYMPQSMQGFSNLIDQVSGVRDMEYQLMTVPPHNGLLTILIYLGLIGVILFLSPFVKAFSYSMRKCNDFIDPTPVVISFSFLLLLVSNQFLEVPYTASIFWLVYGGMVSYVKSCRFNVFLLQSKKLI